MKPTIERKLRFLSNLPYLKLDIDGIIESNKI